MHSLNGNFFDIIQIILGQKLPTQKIIFMSEMKMCTMLKNRQQKSQSSKTVCENHPKCRI